MTITYAKLGSVLGGEIRDKDDPAERKRVLSDLIYTLQGLVVRNTAAMGREASDTLQDCLETLSDARKFTDFEDEDAFEAQVDDIVEIMQFFALPYCFFGASQDGTDYGFWPDISTLHDDAISGDVLKVDDTSAVPDEYRGFVMHVNDHGNVTLYAANGYGKLEEQWACV